MCKDALIQSQVHVTPLHGKVHPTRFYTPQDFFPPAALQPPSLYSLLSVPSYTIVSPHWSDLNISIQEAVLLKVKNLSTYKHSVHN